MKFFTQVQHAQLLKNGSEQERGNDHSPVIKLFTPDADFTWLLTEIDPEDPDMAFGLCDLGQGFPELGYVSLAELATVRGRLGLPIERDLSFTGKFPISIYAAAARNNSVTTLDQSELERASAAQKKG